MADEHLEPAMSQAVFFDGVDDLQIDADVFRCTLYARHKIGGEERRVEAARLACPAQHLPDIINQIVTSLTNAARVLVRVKVTDGH